MAYAGKLRVTVEMLRQGNGLEGAEWGQTAVAQFEQPVSDAFVSSGDGIAGNVIDAFRHCIREVREIDDNEDVLNRWSDFAHGHPSYDDMRKALEAVGR